MSEADKTAEAIASAIAEVANAIDRHIPREQREDMVRLAAERKQAYLERVKELEQQGEQDRERIRSRWHRY